LKQRGIDPESENNVSSPRPVTDILNLIEEGGRAIGLGTFRGVFGKFRIERWD
jgi:hypothetical protein